ncbi:hypothetical protein Hanom_Chr01g00053131 [Helianthus anomalus]
MLPTSYPLMLPAPHEDVPPFAPKHVFALLLEPFLTVLAPNGPVLMPTSLPVYSSTPLLISFAALPFLLLQL